MPSDALRGFLTGAFRDRRNPAGAPGASPSEPLRAWFELVPSLTVGRTYGFARQTRYRGNSMAIYSLHHSAIGKTTQAKPHTSAIS